jgi:hypothetical protein
VTGRDQIEVNGQVIPIVREPFLCGGTFDPSSGAPPVPVCAVCCT